MGALARDAAHERPSGRAYAAPASSRSNRFHSATYVGRSSRVAPISGTNAEPVGFQDTTPRRSQCMAAIFAGGGSKVTQGKYATEHCSCLLQELCSPENVGSRESRRIGHQVCRELLFGRQRSDAAGAAAQGVLTFHVLCPLNLYGGMRADRAEGRESERRSRAATFLHGWPGVSSARPAGAGRSLMLSHPQVWAWTLRRWNGVSHLSGTATACWVGLVK